MLIRVVLLSCLILMGGCKSLRKLTSLGRDLTRTVECGRIKGRIG